jgi:hypothetical protein
MDLEQALNSGRLRGRKLRLVPMAKEQHPAAASHPIMQIT